MFLALSGNGTLGAQIVAALRERILSGALPAGAGVPGTRTLARELGVSRIVVLGAYEQLISEGYLVADIGAGTRVVSRLSLHASGPAPAVRRRVAISPSAKRAVAMMPHRGAAPEPVVRPVIDFSYTTMLPDARTRALWKAAVSRAAADAAPTYPDVAGVLALRRALCAYLERHRGMTVSSEDVVIVNGSQQALDLTARLLGGDDVLFGIEDPHYQGARQAFLASGARLVFCEVDGQGLDVERHAKPLLGARAIYVTPSHQHPTGAIMAIERRLKLLAWAERTGAWIIEDDYDSEFRYGVGAIAALRGLDRRGCVIYTGTFSRTLFPELRLGYVVLPPALRESFLAMKWLSDRGSSPLEQRALAHLLESGDYERSIRRLRRTLEQTQRKLLSALRTSFDQAEVTWDGAHGGTHLFLHFPKIAAHDTERFLAHAQRLGVRMHSGLQYYQRAPRSARVICGYATVDPLSAETGIRRLAKAYRSFHKR